MAYLIPIASRCQYGGCSSRATVQVFNTFNSCVGRFCRKHGQTRVRELERTEADVVRAVVAERKS